MTAPPSVGVSKYMKLETGKLVEVLPQPPTSGADMRTLNLRLGESGSVLGITITPLETLEDSRCPADVQCVWAGRVRLRATLTSGMGTAEQVFELGTPITTEAERITLSDVSPAPLSGTSIAESDYRFTFFVEKK